MTKSESLRRFNLDRYLILSLGFTADEVAALRRISMTLRRWHELECGTDGGVIERDEATGKPYWVNYHSRYLSANDPRHAPASLTVKPEPCAALPPSWQTMRR